MDYALPRAEDTPAAIGWQSHPVPATTNPLGVKGCGEAGCAGAMTSVMNAVVDALSAYGIRHLDMPASPARVWQGDFSARNAWETVAAPPPPRRPCQSRPPPRPPVARGP